MGDNVFLGDRNGVRTPMQWSSDKNAGFSRASPQALFLPITLDPEYHYEAVNVEAQQGNPNSLWWWLKRLLTLRQRHRAFGRGAIQFLRPENRKILAFTRRYESEVILVVANLSRFPQPVQLDLSEFKGMTPIELFGRTEFPAVADVPYAMTLSPHAAFWFSLEKVTTDMAAVAPDQSIKLISVNRDWRDVLQGRQQAALERCLGPFFQRQRWFNRRRQFKGVQVKKMVSVPATPSPVLLTLTTVEFTEGDPEDYLLPLAFAGGEEGDQIVSATPHLVIARVRIEADGSEGILYDACGNKAFIRVLGDAMARRRTLSDGDARLRGFPTNLLRTGESERELGALEPVLYRSQQSNTTVALGEKYFLKIFRRMEPGLNPDLEVVRFLNEKQFPNVPRIAGWLELERTASDRFTAGTLSEFVPNARSAWEFAEDAIGRYFERLGLALDHLTAAAQPEIPGAPGGVSGAELARDHPSGHLLEMAAKEPPTGVVALIGTFLESARLLGQLAADLHGALASDPDNPDFAPEPFTPFYQRSLFQSMRNLTVEGLRDLRRGIAVLPKEVQPDAERVSAMEEAILGRLRLIHAKPIAAARIRCHEDLHLGEILYTGKDFVFIDFEGEPGRPLGDRRIKRSPMRDIASMVRSFDYATHGALRTQIEQGRIHEDRASDWEPWTTFWHGWVSAAFLKAYFGKTQKANLYPQSQEDLAALLDAHLLTKAVYELGHELRHRPDWLKVPLRAILRLMEGDSGPKKT
jgi:maltose alpha-D-glucosyltransferase/alpha-amylase